MEFIEWSNLNNGFVSLLLSALTLFVSILAVIVSVHTARLPYKKKILIVSGSCVSEDGIGLHITATNVGNRDINVKTTGFLIGKIVYINKTTIFESQVILKQGETTSQYFHIEKMRDVIKNKRINTSTKVFSFVEDSEGKIYKKALVRAGKV